VNFKTATVIGSGVVGLITSLSLAKRHCKTTLIDPFLTNSRHKDRPIILPNPAVQYLSTELSEVYTRLLALGAREISSGEVCRSFLSPEKIESKYPLATDMKFLCLRESLLAEVLWEFVHQNPLISLIEGRAQRLEISEKKYVRGVIYEAGILHSDVVFECFGEAGFRQKLLVESGHTSDMLKMRGETEFVLSKIFRLAQEEKTKVPFFLVNREDFRGGIYPLDGDYFAITLSIPEKKIYLTSKEILSEIFAQIIVKEKAIFSACSKGNEVSELIMHKTVGAVESDYYTNDKVRLNHYFPLGSSILRCNPIYGRELTLASLQLKSVIKFLESSSIKTEILIESFKDVRRVWDETSLLEIEAAKGFGWIKKIAKIYYLQILAPLVYCDESFIKRFLLFYHAQISASEVALLRHHFLGWKLFLKRKRISLKLQFLKDNNKSRSNL